MAFSFRRQFKPLALAAILLVCIGLGFAYHATLVDIEGQLAYIEDIIGRMEQEDATWTSNILSVQVGLLPNYDQLTAPVYRMERGRKELTQVSGELALPSDQLPRLAELAKQLSLVVDKKAELGNRVAAQFAILSNSTRYLLVAVDALAKSLDSSDLPLDQRSDAGRLAMLLASRIVGAQIQPVDITAASRQLTRLASIMPQDLADTVRRFVLHSNIILERRKNGNTLLVQLGTMSAAPVLEQIRRVYVEQHDRLAARQQIYRILVVVLAALLVAQIAALGLQLRQNYLQAAQANQQLRRDQHETQSLLLQTAKMCSLGQLVAGIAHEINTPLAYIKATMEMLKEMLETNLTKAKDKVEFATILAEHDQHTDSSLFDDIRTLIGDGVHGVERIADLVQSLKNFSRRDEAEVHAVSVAELADSALTISSHQAKHVAKVQRQYASVPKVRCAPSQIVQVILNLISNAVHAMKARDGRGILTVRIGLERDTMVRIDVSDNGTGIPDDVLTHIFDPFFSTKNSGEGTGLGLSICYRIVRAHNGQLLVDTKIGEGTTLSVLLPVSPVKSDQISARNAVAV